MFCEYCGKEIPEDSIFCEYCGRKQEEIAKTQKMPRVETRPETEPKPTKSGKGKGRTIYYVVLIVVVLGVLLWTNKPWEKIAGLRKPTKVEDQKEKAEAEKKPVKKDKPERETSKDKLDKKDNDEKLSKVDKSSKVEKPTVEKEPEKKPVRTEEVTRPMTPVEIAKESSFLIGAPQVVHIDWIDSTSVKVTIAHYDPGQFDQRPPEWESERWTIDTAYMSSYLAYEDTLELYQVNEDGKYTFAIMKFNMNGNEIESVTITQFNQDGSVYDEGTVDYWPD